MSDASFTSCPTTEFLKTSLTPVDDVGNPLSVRPFFLFCRSCCQIRASLVLKSSDILHGLFSVCRAKTVLAFQLFERVNVHCALRLTAVCLVHVDYPIIVRGVARNLIWVGINGSR